MSNMMDSMKNMAGMASGDTQNKMDSMTGMMQDKLGGLQGEEFDKEFLSMTIKHHQQAIEMAKAAQSNAAHDEIKQLADEMIAEQQAEIDKMQGWQQEWGYSG